MSNNECYVAELKYTDGIPTHLAGEWPGKLPCRFHSYRKHDNLFK